MQDIMLACNPAIEDLIITSRHEAMRHITANFNLYQSQLMAKLQHSISKIHISSDLWTSPNRHSMLAVCARWVDQNYQPKRALLSLQEIRYNHSGESQAQLIFSTLQLYGITSQLGCHTGDNATSNDTCLQHLSAKLQEEYQIKWDPKRHRIRCILHIINLSLQAFLFASSHEALRAALNATSNTTSNELYTEFYKILSSQASSQLNQVNNQAKHSGSNNSKKINSVSTTTNKSWFLNPALRKLHQIGLWIRNSTIHSNIWDERIKLRLGIDNDTRWNSWYRMIDNLLRKKQEIKQFLLDHDKSLGDNILNSSDWEYLERIHTFLQPFTSTTLWAQGTMSTLSQNLMIMDILLRHYEQKKEFYQATKTYDSFMLHSIDMGWFVLNKYYILSEESPIYATALLLDPSKRARYLEMHWKDDWAVIAIKQARIIWEEEYQIISTSESIQRLNETSILPQTQPNELNRLLDEMMVAEDIINDADDFDTFIYAQPIKIEGSPLIWWCQKDQIRTYPRLSLMAINILSAPPGSADAESVFSGGRRTLSWDRESMSCANLERVECIGNWLREGIIVPSSHGGRGLVMDGEINNMNGNDSDHELD